MADKLPYIPTPIINSDMAPNCEARDRVEAYQRMDDLAAAVVSVVLLGFGVYQLVWWWLE